VNIGLDSISKYSLFFLTNISQFLIIHGTYMRENLSNLTII